MDLSARLEPAMAAVFAEFPEMSIADLISARAALIPTGPTPERVGVSREDRLIPGLDGQPDVTVRVYRPEGTIETDRPVLVWFHGGGYVMGHISRDDKFLDRIV